MVDVDTVATFMLSNVTYYFASCGDSLETILEDPNDSHSTFKASLSSKETSDFDQNQTEPVLTCPVDGISICHSIDLDHEGEPFGIQKMNGTDMIFFPRPSSEMPFSQKPLIRKKHPQLLPEMQEERSRGDVKIRSGELDNTSLILGNKGVISAKSVISPPPEVTSRWIAMGLLTENVKNTVPSHHHNHHHQQHQPFPFDEMKIENSKKRPPLAIRGQSRFGHKLKSTKVINAPAVAGARLHPEALNNRNNSREVRDRTPTSTTTTNSGDDYTLFLRDNYNNIVIRNFDSSQYNSTHRINYNKMSSHWKSAVDPRSGQTYFFHEITRETQWRKPMELATDEEKSAMEEKEQKEKDFFAAMEANILSSLSRGVIPGTPAQPKKEEDYEGTPGSEGNLSRISSRKSLRRVRSRAGRPEMVRTISTMDESVLKDVILRQPSFRSLNPGLSKKPSLQFEDLSSYMGSVSRSSESQCSSSDESQSSILETLEEGIDESARNIEFDSMPDTRILEQSISAREDLNDEETKALNKLFSLTKEMMDADEDRPNEEFSQSVRTIAVPAIPERSEFNSRALRRVTDGDLGRTLPRELELEDSGGKNEVKNEVKKEKATSGAVPRRGRAARMLANSGKSAADLLKSGVQRRNTCGTMYIRTTMSAPDKDATIRCVCGVYRSHIISSEHLKLSVEETESLNVFNDYPDDTHGMENQNPTLNEITTFYRDIFFKAQMEADCIIMSLIYVERLIKKTGGHLRPKATNWRSLLFSCMILSSKVWDDLSMWNADFSQSCPPGGVNFSLQRINQLELAILNTLKFNVKVPASEYAKYYFLLRSMLIKSGLGGEDLGSLNPLDVDGARRLAQVSSQFESMSLNNSSASLDFGRSKSMAVDSSRQSSNTFRQPKTKIGLEQVVKM